MNMQGDMIWTPNVGPYIQHKKVWRWEVIGGLCMMNGWRTGAELGVSTGRFTIFLCSLMPDMHMISVDLWAEQPENKGAETYLEDAGWRHEKHYEHFKKVCQESFPGRVKIIRDWTTNAAKLVEDGSLDFVFVDADHSYEACKADIEAWTPKVRQGGAICGHDLAWPGVNQAVRESGPYAPAPNDCWVRMLK